MALARGCLVCKPSSICTAWPGQGGGVQALSAGAQDSVDDADAVFVSGLMRASDEFACDMGGDVKRALAVA